MAEKNYKAFHERIQAFKSFVIAQGWTIVAEKEIVMATKSQSLME